MDHLHSPIIIHARNAGAVKIFFGILSVYDEFEMKKDGNMVGKQWERWGR